MAEPQQDRILYEVKNFEYVRGNFTVTLEVRKPISGKMPYRCHVHSNMTGVLLRGFPFTAETEEEVIEKMLEKLKAVDDLELLMKS